ncbi:MAG: CRTAC1 family protein [Acidobacteriaceae bacterium]
MKDGGNETQGRLQCPITRREFLWMTAASMLAMGQGITTRNVRPLPRGKPSGIPFLARFTDVAAQSGLTSPVIYGGVTHKHYIVETVGCGAAFLDYDNDGWLDVLVLCGTRMEEPVPGSSNRLYKNNRDGTFTDVTEKAGLLRTGWASGVTVGDYNNDGFEDIFITYYGQNALYRNNGDGTFTDVTRQSGLLYEGNPRWGSGCTFLDYDRDGHLDLFVANYVDLHLDRLPKPGANPYCNFKGVGVNCGPRGLPMPRNYLYRNQGDGTFRDVSREAGIARAQRTYSMTTVAADFDGDGWTDIYVASDSTPSLFFRNQHNGTFIENGAELGVAFSVDGAEQAGMGVAVGDYNLDGNLDIFKTHFADDTNVLYRNDGGGNFTDVTIPAGFGVETRYTCWGAGFADFDNDGWPDLAVVTGSVYPEVEAAFPDYPLKTPRFIFRNLGNGKFEELIGEAGPGIAAMHCSRGCAFGDFDNDGDVDMVIINLNEPPSLLRNDLAGNHNWLKVFLVGTKSNVSAIGTRVLVRYAGKVQAQAVLGQSSFYSVNDRRLHFGLAANTHVDLEIHWTNGLVEKFSGIAANQLVTVKEGHGISASALPGLKATASRRQHAAPTEEGAAEG